MSCANAGGVFESRVDDIVRREGRNSRVSNASKQYARLHVQAFSWDAASRTGVIGKQEWIGGGLRGCRTWCAARCMLRPLARPVVATRNPPSATGCRRMLEPGTQHSSYCAAHLVVRGARFGGLSVDAKQ